VAWVYILRCGDNTFSVGRTQDLDARVRCHQAGHGATYTAARLPVELVYTETFSSLAEAAARERQLKRWSSAKKAALVRRDVDALVRLSRRRRPERQRRA
jgi:putative endonuclease